MHRERRAGDVPAIASDGDGGHVRRCIERVGERRFEPRVGDASRDELRIGAGHIAQALTSILVNLDCNVTCIDPRQEWLDKLPQSPKLKAILTSDMPSMVKTLPDDAFVVLMTMGHTTDKPILIEILRTRTFPYLGVIGSNSKAVILKRDVAEAGLPKEMESAFFCPVGLDVGTNHPYEIAVSIVAQMMQVRDGSRAAARTP